MVEHHLDMVVVGGSIPLAPTNRISNNTFLIDNLENTILKVTSNVIRSFKKININLPVVIYCMLLPKPKADTALRQNRLVMTFLHFIEVDVYDVIAVNRLFHLLALLISVGPNDPVV